MSYFVHVAMDEPREKQIDGIAPTFSKKPAIRQEEDGKRLLFECRIQADPKPTVTWWHNATPVLESPRHKVCLIYLVLLLTLVARRRLRV